MTWQEQLFEYLRRLCEIVNGAPCGMSESTQPSVWVATVYTTWQSHGCPDPPPSDWSQLLSDLETHLDSPNNTLSPDDDGKLREIIDVCG